MEQFHIGLAGKVIAITARFPATRRLCRDYLTDAPPDFAVEISLADLAYERRKLEKAQQDISAADFSDTDLESLSVHRKIVERMPDYHTILFHASAIAVDGIGYLFAAPSGTGKSTHARLWRELFGSRAVMVNDDKPLLHITDSGVTVFGTPWDGKHHLSSPISVPLRAICILERSAVNSISPLAQKDAWPLLMQQVYRPANPVQLEKTLALVDQLGKGVSLYHLKCNMHPSAAQIAYDGMQERKSPPCD